MFIIFLSVNTITFQSFLVLSFIGKFTLPARAHLGLFAFRLSQLEGIFLGGFFGAMPSKP